MGWNLTCMPISTSKSANWKVWFWCMSIRVETYEKRTRLMDCFPPSESMNCENNQYTTSGDHFTCTKSPTRVNGESENADNIKSSELGDEGCRARKSSLFPSQRYRAAVLVCLFEGLEGELRVILTKRSMKLSTHPGEVALPGGKMDEEDANEAATALREATEEIGLDPNLVRVIGNLEPFISSHLITVVPVVGLLTTKIQEFKPVLNADEVDAIFDVPMEMFLKEDSYRCLEKEWEGIKYICHLYDFKSDQGTFVIGGLTASILIETASIVFQRRPSFSRHLPDFSQLQLTLSATG